jgi:hypothetical protein
MAETWFREASHYTARASAFAFAFALAAPLLSEWARRRRVALFAAFAALHALHFAVVAFFAASHPQAAIFPGERSATQVGGWPAIAGIVALFAVLVMTAIHARGARAGQRAKLAGRGAVALLTFMFVATYLPLTSRSPWYFLPALLITAAAALDVFGGKRCFHTARCSSAAARSAQ